LEGITNLRPFAQGGRYFVNLMRNLPVAKTENPHENFRDQMVPLTNVRDDLIAVEPGRSTPLWRIVSPNRSFVQWGRTPSPALLGLSVVKARNDNQRRWLVVETLDPATGLRLGYADQLPEMRLFHADYDGQSGTIRLIGDKGDIELRFGREVQLMAR
jgi:hypothetical protein